MLQLALTIIIFLIIVIPVGRYMYHIATWNHTLADPVFDRLDGVIYKIGGVNPHQGMNWRQYALALVGTNAVMVAIGYLILRIQSVGIFNPNSIGNMEPTLAFNTIISFMTNTNLQHYSGESGLSYLSQMLVIIFMMFVSAASGYAACIAFIRGLTGKTKDDVGNFFADLTRITTRLLLPFSIVGGLLLVWQGVPQNFDANIVVNTLEGTFQTIAMGPIAALEIIKHLGTNGGGFLGANSTTPLENPTIISDMIELYSMMLFPGACVITFGKMVRGRKKKEISAFIVERTDPGFSVGKHEKKMGIKGSSTCELIMEDCIIPKDRLLGKQGKGFGIAMKTLDGGRIGIASQALGLAEGAIEETIKYTKERVQFGRRISQFQNTQFQLADMHAKTEAAKWLVYSAAMKKENHEPYTVDAAMAKLVAAETASDVTRRCVQLFGGYGYTREYPMERMMRDAKITEIYEGTSEVQRMVISANLGVN